MSKYANRYTFDDAGNIIDNPSCIPGLKETRLIQRFKFRGDGLSPCYMGSYEFEIADIRGTLTKVISGIKEDSYSMVSLHVFGPPEFSLESSGRIGLNWYDLEGIQKKFLLEANILIFCPNCIHSYMEEFFQELAFEDKADRRLQEPSLIRDSLFSKAEWNYESAGNREWSSMYPDALLGLDNAVLALLTEPCARYFCETFGVVYIDGSVQPADFTKVDEALQLLQQREPLHNLEKKNAKKKKHPRKIPG